MIWCFLEGVTGFWTGRRGVVSGLVKGIVTYGAVKLSQGGYFIQCLNAASSWWTV